MEHMPEHKVFTHAEGRKGGGAAARPLPGSTKCCLSTAISEVLCLIFRNTVPATTYKYFSAESCCSLNLVWWLVKLSQNFVDRSIVTFTKWLRTCI